jgi:MFS transporter, putative metabolite:H+ symporter
MFSYIGLAAGDLISGFASQAVRSRKKTVFVFILLTLIFITTYLYWPFANSKGFYVGCFFLGLGVGYWALFVTIAAEQFGTNLRSTVATTVPNFIRGSVVPLTFMFGYLRDNLNILQAALIVGVFTILIAFWALRLIDETFSRDLNFIEKDQ